MDFENIFRRVSIALIAAVYILLVGIVYVAEAQTRVIAGSRITGFGAPHTAERVVLHSVRFRARSDKIDKCSVPVLDYALQIINQNPESLVYVKILPVHNATQEYTGSSSSLIIRRTRAVTSYFEHRGISANRLILLDSGGSPHTPHQGADKAQSLRRNFEVVQLELASELD